MSFSQEFIQAELDQRRRTTDHLQLLHSAASSTRGDRHTRHRPSGPARFILGPLSRAIHRCSAWLSASQLGPLPTSTSESKREL